MLSPHERNLCEIQRGRRGAVRLITRDGYDWDVRGSSRARLKICGRWRSRGWATKSYFGQRPWVTWPDAQISQNQRRSPAVALPWSSPAGCPRRAGAHGADEAVLDIGQPQLVGLAVGVIGHNVAMATPAVAAVDQHIAHASGAHLAKVIFWSLVIQFRLEVNSRPFALSVILALSLPTACLRKKRLVLDH